MPRRPSDTLPSTRRIRRAYEQVADQLRDWILSGTLSVGDRLPPEVELARQFQTSRSTVREALRLLSSESLVISQAGAHGGSTVTMPDVGRVAGSLQTALTMMVRANDLTLPELYSVREMLEVPTAALAAAHRQEADLDRLRALLPADPSAMTADELLYTNRAFHEQLISTSGNRLLPLFISPIFDAASTRFKHALLEVETRQARVHDHEEIFEAVANGDQTAAADAMERHLRSFYMK